MLRLVHGESYLWLFPIFVVVFFGGFLVAEIVAGQFNWGILTLPGFGLWLLIVQYRSGIALDSWWRATHLRGSKEYRLLFAWQTFWLIWVGVLTYFFLVV